MALCICTVGRTHWSLGAILECGAVHILQDGDPSTRPARLGREVNLLAAPTTVVRMGGRPAPNDG